MSATFHLYRLQKIDSQIDKVQKRLDDIQRIIDDNRELKHAKTVLKKCEAAHEKTEKALHQAENEVKAQHIKIEQTESMLYGGSLKNPKEIQDLQNKADSLKRYLSKLQDDQIEAMLVHEEEGETLQTAQNALNGIRNKLIQQNSQLGGEQTVLTQDMDRLVKERDAALREVPADMFSKYTQLRKQKKWICNCHHYGWHLLRLWRDPNTSPSAKSSCRTRLLSIL